MSAFFFKSNLFFLQLNFLPTLNFIPAKEKLAKNTKKNVISIIFLNIILVKIDSHALEQIMANANGLF